MAAPAGAGAPVNTVSAGQQGCHLSGSPRAAGSAASAGQGPTPERATPWEPPGTPPRSLPCRGLPGCAENPVGFRVGAPARDAAERPSLGHMMPGAAAGPGGMGAGPEQAEGLARPLQAGEALRAGKPLDLKPVDTMGLPFWAACGTKVPAGGDAEPILAPPTMLQARDDSLPRDGQCGSSVLAREHSKVRRSAVVALQRRAEADSETAQTLFEAIDGSVMHPISACCLQLHSRAQNHKVCSYVLMDTVSRSTLTLSRCLEHSRCGAGHEHGQPAGGAHAGRAGGADALCRPLARVNMRAQQRQHRRRCAGDTGPCVWRAAQQWHGDGVCRRSPEHGARLPGACAGRSKLRIPCFPRASVCVGGPARSAAEHAPT